jgi:hypothetical protein
MSNYKQPNKPKPTKAIMDALYGTHDFKEFTHLPDFEQPKAKPKRKVNTNRQSEANLQKAIVKWFRLQYPNLSQMLNYNLNNSRNMISAVNNSYLGLNSGRNDLSLYYRGYALLIELKATDGKLSDKQKRFQTECELAGNYYRITDNFDDAMKVIQNFITWCDDKNSTHL